MSRKFGTGAENGFLAPWEPGSRTRCRSPCCNMLISFGVVSVLSTDIRYLGASTLSRDTVARRLSRVRSCLACPILVLRHCPCRESQHRSSDSIRLGTMVVRGGASASQDGRFSKCAVPTAFEATLRLPTMQSSLKTLYALLSLLSLGTCMCSHVFLATAGTK